VDTTARVQSLTRTHKDLPSLEQTLQPPDAGAAELPGISGHDKPDREIMVVFKESKSPNHKDGEPVADEVTVELQSVLENESMIAADASEENESLE
jgi:hypothetical protein